MDAKGSKPAPSPQLAASRGNKAESVKGKDASPTSCEPTGSKSASRGDARAVMLTVGSSQKTGSLEHVAQIHKPGPGQGQGSGQGLGQGKSLLTTHSSEPKLHKSPNSSRAPMSSTDSPRTPNPRHNLVVTTFRVPAKESPKTQHSKASSSSQISAKDSPKTSGSASPSQTAAAKDSKNHNKLAASHIPVKVSPKMTKASSKTSMKDSPSNTSSTPLSLSDDLSPVSDDGNLVHALRVDVSPVTAPPVGHQEVKREAEPISPVKQDSQKPKEAGKSAPSPQAQHRDALAPARSPQAQPRDALKPLTQKEAPQAAASQHKPPRTTTATQQDNAPALTVQSTHNTAGSQHSVTPNSKRQTSPQVTTRQTSPQVTARQAATPREKSEEKKGKESDGKGGVRSKEAGKSVATMTVSEGSGKDVGVQVSDDLCNGAAVTASQLGNHVAGAADADVSAQEDAVVMRSQKPAAGKRPSSQYVCQIEIELCSQSQSQNASGAGPQPGVSAKPVAPSLCGKSADGPGVPSDPSEAGSRAEEPQRQEKAGPVQEVTWDAQGLTWEVYGATLDWQALGSAVQRHLQAQIEQLELRLKSLQSSVSEKEKESETEREKSEKEREKSSPDANAAARRPKRKCRCWFHCSSCCCRRKQHNA